MDWKTFGINLGQNAISSVANNVLGTGLNWLSQKLGLTMSQEEAMQKQYEYNNEIMGLQNKYQQEAAKMSQEYAKEYWNYTNVGNQLKHLKENGLNPSLIYGQSGAGGMGATGGAKQESPSQPQTSPILMGIQMKDIEQKQKMNDASIALAEAQASKARAEAEKIGGVDIREVLQNIDESLSRIELNKKQGELYEADIILKNTLKDLNEEMKNTQFWETLNKQENVKAIQAMATKYAMEARDTYYKMKESKINAQFAEETYIERVRQVTLMNTNIIVNTALARANIKVAENQINLMNAEISELNTRAIKNNMDATSYRKQVEAIIKRVGDQNVNEKWHLTNETVNTIVDSFTKIIFPL